MLLSLALDDESTLSYPLPDQIFGFHAQQSCEKLLKSLISSHDVRYDLTHSLAKLMEKLTECLEMLPSLPFNLINLEPFAVQFRYEEGPPLTDSERREIRESVSILRHHVVSRILELERLP